MAAHDPLDEAHEETSLDMLENEDRRILAISAEVDDNRDTAIEDRAEYGNRAKLLIRHFAAREAALLDVADGLMSSSEPPLSELGERFVGDPQPRRQLMDRVEKMSRGVQGINLNTGQDFDAELRGLLEQVRPELEWDLAQGIPRVRRQLPAERQSELFHSADHVARHAPTNLDPKGPRWWERAPVVSRLVTVVHHLRDYPRATRDART